MDWLLRSYFFRQCDNALHNLPTVSHIINNSAYHQTTMYLKMLRETWYNFSVSGNVPCIGMAASFPLYWHVKRGVTFLYLGMYLSYVLRCLDTSNMHVIPSTGLLITDFPNVCKYSTNATSMKTFQIGIFILELISQECFAETGIVLVPFQLWALNHLIHLVCHGNMGWLLYW